MENKKDNLLGWQAVWNVNIYEKLVYNVIISGICDRIMSEVHFLKYLLQVLIGFKENLIYNNYYIYIIMYSFGLDFFIKYRFI